MQSVLEGGDKGIFRDVWNSELGRAQGAPGVRQHTKAVSQSGGQGLGQSGGQGVLRDPVPRSDTDRVPVPVANDSAGEAGEARALFQMLWSGFPRKEGKDAALREFLALTPTSALLAEMLEALTIQHRSPQWREQEGRFIPALAKWLRDGRWKDARPDESRRRCSYRGCAFKPACSDDAEHCRRIQRESMAAPKATPDGALALNGDVK
jgi:hypothetical protein